MDLATSLALLHWLADETKALVPIVEDLKQVVD